MSHAAAQTAGKGPGKEETAGTLLACSGEFGALLLSVSGGGSLGMLKEESHRTQRHCLRHPFWKTLGYHFPSL